MYIAVILATMSVEIVSIEPHGDRLLMTYNLVVPAGEEATLSCWHLTLDGWKPAFPFAEDHGEQSQTYGALLSLSPERLHLIRLSLAASDRTCSHTRIFFPRINRWVD